MRSLSASTLVLLLGCSMFSIDPVIEDHHTVVPSTDVEDVLVLYKRLGWANGPDSTATHAVSLPVGEYVFEGENEDFRYFRAPTPITMGTFRNGTRTGGYDFAGGVAMATSALAQIPAEVYVSKSSTEKIHVMRLGYDFYLMRDEAWTLREGPR
jgi:hypothetical protein